MDDTSSLTVDSLQKRVLELERQNEALAAAKTSLAVIASNALDALGRQTPSPHPEGFWVTASEVDHLRDLKDLGVDSGVAVGEVGGSGRWVWVRVSKPLDPACIPRYPGITSSSTRSQWFKTFPKYDPRPFSRAFPLEVFEAIITRADRQAISRTAQASFACYQLFMPVLFDNITGLPEKDLEQMLGAEPTLSKSARLDPARSLQHVRSMTVTTDVLNRLPASWTFDVDRLPPGQTALHLDHLNLIITDRKEIEEQWFVETLPVLTSQLLVHVNPTKLAMVADIDESELFAPFLIGQDAAAAMFRWSRLRTVEVDTINILALEPEGVDGVFDSEGVFFLRSREDESAGLQEVSVFWDISYHGELPSFGQDSLVQYLLVRDDTLRQPWLKAFTIIVSSVKYGEALQKLIDDSVEEVPNTLHWRVMDAINA